MKTKKEESIQSARKKYTKHLKSKLMSAKPYIVKANFLIINNHNFSSIYCDYQLD